MNELERNKPVIEFENLIADFYNAPYAVATDCCTNAMELSLRLEQSRGNNTAKCTKYTYVCVPNMLNKIKLDWHFTDEKWTGFYHLTDTTIDAAVFWKQGGYIPNTRMCLSFQYGKHLSSIRGGMILLDNKDDAELLRKMTYDGRVRNNLPFWEQEIDTVGYHYYMPPMLAKIGLENFDKVKDAPVKAKNWDWYRDVSKYPIFQKT